MKTDIVIVVVGVALFGLVWIGWQSFDRIRVEDQKHRNVVCTLDAKECADGTFVGRIPPRCDFAPCPRGR